VIRICMYLRLKKVKFCISEYENSVNSIVRDNYTIATILLLINVCVCVCVYMCLCACVCVCL
jgi:hypothetical protein